MQKHQNKHKLTEQSIEARHTGKITSLNNSITDISSDGLSALWKDLLGAGAKDMLGQLGGYELKPNQPQSIRKEKKKEDKPVTEMHHEYVRTIKNADIAPQKREQASMNKQINELRMEIKKLIAESKQLESTFKTVQVEQKVVKVGVYHQNLFEFVKFLIISARVKLKEGASWMNAVKSKKQQRQYQAMAKKHGTSFTLNNERTVATQTG